MNKPLQGLVLAGMTLATACSSIPKPSPAWTPDQANANINLDQPYAVYDQYTQSSDQASSLATLRWQDFYADDKLKRLIELTLANNKDLQKAALAIANARAQYQIMDAKDVPSVGLSSSASRNVRAGDANPFSAFQVGLVMSSYEIDFWGKVANQKQAALNQFLATAAAKDTVQISLISGVAQAYVNLSYALAQKQLAIETLKTREHSLVITQKRFEAGLDSRSASLQAESSLEMAKLAVYAADEQILKAKNALQFLVAAPISQELLPDMAVDKLVNPSLFQTGLPSELLMYRPDIIQAEYSLRAAGANINVARAAYFPSISLATNIGFSSNALGDLLGSSRLGWSFGPNLNLPIFDAGIRKANHQMAVIAQESARASYEKAIQVAFREVADVLAVRATLDRQLASEYKLQDNYQKTYQIAHARFRAGLDSYLGVLDAERALFANQQSILQMEQKQILSQIQLYQALGGGASLPVDKQIDHAQQD